MPSLLDAFLARGGTSGLMARRAEAERQGLLGPPPEPTPPSLFDPGSPAAAMADARQAAGAPMTGQGAASAQRQPRGQGNSGEMVRRTAGFLSAEISEVAGDVPRGAEDWIQAAARDTVNSSPGRDGRPFLARLFAGEKVPGLSDAQNKRLLKNSLVATGLNVMGAPAGVTWPQALAMGILGARQQVTSTAGELLDERQRQQRILSRYQVLADTDMSELARMKELRRRMLSEGDTEGAKAVDDVIKRLEEEPAGRDNLTFKTVDGVPVFVDEEAGAVYDLEGNKITELGQQQDPNAERKRVADRVNQLSDDFESAASDAQDVANAVNIGLDAPANAAGDVTLLTMLTRAIDPGVSVREADIKRGEQIGGVPERVQQAINTVASSGEMSEEQRQFIRSEIRRVGLAQRRAFRPMIERYTARARQAGVDPSLVVFDPFAPVFSGQQGADGGGAADQPDLGPGTEDPFAGPPPGEGGGS